MVKCIKVYGEKYDCNCGGTLEIDAGVSIARTWACNKCNRIVGTNSDFINPIKETEVEVKGKK